MSNRAFKKSNYFLESGNINAFLNSNANNYKNVSLEVGMGKGNFIISHSKKYKDKLFIGLEKYPSVQVSALKKIKEDVSNLKLISFDAQNLNMFFQKKSIDRIYINFPDPWPKSRHEKRRLVSLNFLKIYLNILKDNGEIEFKTDQKELFVFFQEVVKNNDLQFKIIKKRKNLHLFNKKVIKTEYESKFIQKGKKIYFLRIKKIPMI